ncbi:hypothetical protein FACS1894124_4990 [Spirochaetia bacterium]|nr:hypothetical protein FACS1894124_4990 [Spirochaetia bacterium]
MSEKIPVDLITYETDRNHGGFGDIENLAESIKKTGLINAITICRMTEPPLDNGTAQFRIIAGRRRFEAVKLLGWTEIPVEVRDEEGADEVALIENTNREAMHPLDEAIQFKKQLDAGRDIAELAKYYNRSVSAIYQRVRLTNLVHTLRDMFRAGDMPITAAAMLASLDPVLQDKFYGKEKNNGNITVYAVERFLHSVHNNRLVCITNKKCDTCQNRTRHTDKSLFPELNNSEDVCFDHDCYQKKWTALIAKELKKASSDMTETATAVFLDYFPLSFDDTIKLNGVEYPVKKMEDYQSCDEKEPGSFFAWEIEYSSYRQAIDIEGRYWRERAVEQKTAKGSKFEVCGIIGSMAMEENQTDVNQVTARIDSKLKQKFEGGYKLRLKIKFELVKKLLAGIGDRNFNRELLREDFYDNDETTELYKLITGLEWDEEFTGIETVDPAKIVTLFFVLHYDEYKFFPDFEAEKVEERYYPGLELIVGGVTQMKALYTETAREVITAALEATDEPDP